jgi:flagellar motor switch protein FliN/FliY
MKMADETTQVPSATDEKSSAATEGRPLGFLMDVRLQVSVELGRRRYRISELLSLDQGEILELDKVAGEPLDIRVNDHLIARGEAVVVNDKFGVRLTEIIMPADRMGNLDLMEKS